MSNTAWLVVALVVVAAAIGSYVWSLVARRRRLMQRLEELERDKASA